MSRTYILAFMAFMATPAMAETPAAAGGNWGVLEISGGGGGSVNPAVDIGWNTGVKVCTDDDAVPSNDCILSTPDNTMLIQPGGSTVMSLASGGVTVTGDVTASGSHFDNESEIGTVLIDCSDDPYTVLATDHVIVVDTDAGGACTGNMDVALPASACSPATADACREIVVYNIGTTQVDVDPNGTEEISAGGAGVVSSVTTGNTLSLTDTGQANYQWVAVSSGGGSGVDPASDLSLNTGSKLILDADGDSSEYLISDANIMKAYGTSGFAAYAGGALYFNTNTGGTGLVDFSKSPRILDNVNLQFGNLTAGDAWFKWDTATTPDQLSLSNTDCDGIGGDCVIFYTEAGSPNLFLRNGEFIQNETDGKITLGGSGGTFNENLIIEFETTNNRVFFNTSSGLSYFQFAETLLLNEGATMVNGAQPLSWSGGAELFSDADGQLQIENAANTSGATLDVDDAADTIVVKDQAGTGNGNLKVTGTLSGLNGEFISNATDGKITLGGSGGTNNEDLTIDFETTANRVVVASSTGAAYLDLGSSLSLIAAYGLFNNDVRVGSAYKFHWLARSELYSPADGQLRITNDAATSGATLDVDDAADTIVVKDQAGTGNGNLTVTGISTLTGGAVLPVQTSATPSEPATCDASAKGRIEVVDDSDDGAGTQVCYCGMTDDSTYDWLNLTSGAACTFY